MIRTRVTRIEAFRRVLLGWGDESELIADLQGKPVAPSWQMEAGTAFHKLLDMDDPTARRPAMCEGKRNSGNIYPTAGTADFAATQIRAKSGDNVEPFRCTTCGDYHVGKPTGREDEFGSLESDGWFFRPQDWSAVRQQQGSGLREVTAYRDFGPVNVSGTCDHIRGLMIRDTKCKFTPIDAKSYEQSLQWRFYLLLHEADCFAYDLLAFKEDNHRLELLDIVTVRFWRYDGLEDDCRQWAERFAQWYESKFPKGIAA